MTISRSLVLTSNVKFALEVPELHRPSGKESRYVYKVTRVPALNNKSEKIFIASEVEGRFSYLGTLDDFTGQVYLTQGSRFEKNSFRLRLLNKILARVWSEDYESFEQHGFKAEPVNS